MRALLRSMAEALSVPALFRRRESRSAEERASEWPRKATAGNERITVGLTPQVAATLADLIESTGMRQTDLVNRAITLYAFVEGQTAQGRDLLTRGEDGTVYLVAVNRDAAP